MIELDKWGVKVAHSSATPRTRSQSSHSISSLIGRAYNRWHIEQRRSHPSAGFLVRGDAFVGVDTAYEWKPIQRKDLRTTYYIPRHASMV